MRVVFFISNISTFKDRIKMLLELSNGLDELILIIGVNDAEINLNKYKNIRLIEVIIYTMFGKQIKL